MVPTATVNATALLGAAGTTVNQFSALVLLVGGLALGVWGVRFIIRRVKARG